MRWDMMGFRTFQLEELARGARPPVSWTCRSCAFRPASPSLRLALACLLPLLPLDAQAVRRRSWDMLALSCFSFLPGQVTSFLLLLSSLLRTLRSTRGACLGRYLGGFLQRMAPR